MDLIVLEDPLLIKKNLGQTRPLSVRKLLKETHLLANRDDFSLTSLSVPSIL